MTKGGISASTGAGLDEVAIAADAARVEAERLATERAANASKMLPPSTGNVTYEIEDPKLFTSGDMEKALQHALENQRKEMEASFAKLKASASESQTSSGAAPRSPQAPLCTPVPKLLCKEVVPTNGIILLLGLWNLSIISTAIRRY